MSGVFGNPNEASLASLLGVALVLICPFSNRVVNFVCLAIGVGGVLLTFSKTGFFALLILLAVWWCANARLSTKLVSACVVLSATAFIHSPGEYTTMVAESEFLSLDAHQRDRLIDVGELLGGQLDSDTSTGRTELWENALAMGMESFPFGAGLGSAHSMIGKRDSHGHAQGAHNTFLMVFAEAGILPFALLVAAFLLLLRSTVGCGRDGLGHRVLLFVLTVDMLASHGNLALRYHNVMLGVLLGFAAPSRIAPHGIRCSVNPSRK